MRIGSRQKWHKYLAQLSSEQAQKRFIKRQRRFQRKKSLGWSMSSRQRYGNFYSLELSRRPNAAEIAFGNLLCELDLLPFDFQRAILRPKLFILDFYMPKHFVAFEIDGSSHNDKSQKDIDRDKTLQDERAIKTYRFKNDELWSDLVGVKNRIQQALRWECI